MRGYPVYKMDQATRNFVRVGSILEQRRSRRSMNRIGLAKLAQRLFASASGDIICVGAETGIDRHELVPAPVSVLNAGESAPQHELPIIPENSYNRIALSTDDGPWGRLEKRRRSHAYGNGQVVQ